MKGLVILLPCLFAVCLASLSNKAMNCICDVESNCNTNIGCVPDGGSLSCGPYQIKEVYWIDCGRPGGSWQTCANSKSCSEGCINAYMDRYGTYCTGGRTPNDQDYARIHNGGPLGCTYSSTLVYWDKVKSCCDSGLGSCNY